MIVTNYLWRPLFPSLLDLVDEGGVLLYDTFARGNEAYGRPTNLAFLLEPGELIEVRGRLQIVAYEAGTSRPAARGQAAPVRRAR